MKGIGDKVGHGDELQVNCTDNFELEHEGDPVMCDNGNFSQLPQCFPARYLKDIHFHWWKKYNREEAKIQIVLIECMMLLNVLSC